MIVYVTRESFGGEAETESAFSLLSRIGGERERRADGWLVGRLVRWPVV